MGILQTFNQRLSGIWSKRTSSETSTTTSEDQKANADQKPQRVPQYDPSLPPLLPIQFTHVLPSHHYNLADQGWTTITFPTIPTTSTTSSLSTSPPDLDPLQSALSDLFTASQTFFNQPEDYKSSFSAKNAAIKDGSEEGFSSIPGEKQFITLRRDDASHCPSELRDSASKVWSLAGNLLNSMLGQIAASLDLDSKFFTKFSEPCLRLDEIKRGTMLRLFRYENTDPKVVAEAHADLGLLSLVIGDTPGLEVWNKYQNRFVPIETTYDKGQASVLVGRQLQKFSNGRYTAGGHRVVAYSPSELTKFSKQRMDERYRFSIVFVLRADWNVLVDTDEMTSDITGSHAEPIRGVRAEDFFRQIQARHFNINIGLEERARQKVAMAEEAKRRGLVETENGSAGRGDCPAPPQPAS